MIGNCELCKRLGDLNDCSLCGRRVCGSCMRNLEGKNYCVACVQKTARESPEAAKKRTDAISVALLLLVLASAVVMYPKYSEVEKMARYGDFSGLVPVEHNRTAGRLVVVLENQVNQPLLVSSVRSTGNCSFEGGAVKPKATFVVSCDNSTADRLYLDYSVGGFAIKASGRIPQ